MQYLIKDFGTEATPIQPASLRIVDDSNSPNGLWAELDKARDMKQKISVYQLPDCVLDWS